MIDKDLASALLAEGLDADVLVLATDVDAVYVDWGEPAQRALGRVTPALCASSISPQGSMGPKVEAVCRFVERTGRRAAIGQLENLAALVAGTAGTQVVAVTSRPGARDDRERRTVD